MKAEGSTDSGHNRLRPKNTTDFKSKSSMERSIGKQQTPQGKAAAAQMKEESSPKKSLSTKQMIRVGGGFRLGTGGAAAVAGSVGRKMEVATPMKIDSPPKKRGASPTPHQKD